MDSTPADVRDSEARALKQLFEQRAKMTQAEFGRRFDIGTAGMVWQYLNGRRPLNIAVASKFATGLETTIETFSPRLAAEIAQASSLASAEPSSAPRNRLNRDDLALADVLKSLPKEERREVLDQIAAKLVRARARYTNKEFHSMLDALDRFQERDRDRDLAPKQ